MREVTREWLSKADGDYRSAQILLYQIDDPEIDTGCFHCQQCAEKYVKAFLTEQDVDFPRNHDLIRLLGLCLTVDGSFEKIRDPLRKLENYGAHKAFENAGRVREFVRKKLKLE